MLYKSANGKTYSSKSEMYKADDKWLYNYYKSITKEESKYGDVFK